MKYILENINENDRLEYQALQRNYSPEFDFLEDELILPDHSIVLDAGCGSGVVSRLIAKKNLGKDVKVLAIDSCEDQRLEDAKRRAIKNGLSSIHFQKGDIRKLALEDCSVDVVISRFVYEHNPGDEAFKAITQEAYRVLKPNGVYYVIDTDGVLANISSDNKEFMLLTEKLLQAVSDVFEPYPCRKLPQFLSNAGFKFKIIKNIPMIFHEPSDLEYEDALWKVRFNNMKHRINQALGERSKWYVNQFFEELWNRDNLYYCNRFVFKAFKDGGALLNGKKEK